MNNSQVAHVWAQQKRAGARGSSFFFEGPVIYSFGYHFPIARFIEHKGKRAVLFTIQSYSISTSKHISVARGALYGLDIPIFDTPAPTEAPDSKTMRAYYQAEIAALVEKAARARINGEWHMSQARAIALKANEAAQFFGWRWRIAEPTLAPDTLAKLKAAHAKQVAKDKIKRAEQAKKEAAYGARVIREWRAGLAVRTNNMQLPTMLRVQGDKVQTSRGAEIPAAHAGRVWRAVCEVMRTGTPYQRNGHTIHAGEFSIDSIGTDGTLRAGCHTIKYDELAAVAETLGLEGGAA